MAKTRSLSNPAERRIPVNVSLPINLLDLLEEEAFKTYGGGNFRSKVVVDILKEHFHVR